MITQERVESVTGSMVQTNQGTRRCAGNASIAVGDMVTVLDGLILGWQRRTAARPQTIAPKHYRLADAQSLKMHWVDEYFLEIDTQDIPRPEEDTGSEAVLVIHCYNESTEYLVWFIESRCIIQKDGATIADFTSVFPSVPWESDGYIDDSGDLIWGAAVGYNDVATMATYKNGALITLATSIASTVIADYIARIEQRAAAAEITVEVVQNDPEVNDYTVTTIGGVSGVVYHAEYGGCTVSSDGGYARIGSGKLFDCLSANGFFPIASDASTYVNAQVVAEERDGYGNMTDDSYSIVGLVTQLRNTTVFATDGGGVVAEKQAQSEDVADSVSDLPFSMTAEIVFADTPTAITGTVVTRAGYTNSPTVFVMVSLEIINDEWTDYGLRNENVIVTGVGGGNAGLSRTGHIAGIGLSGGVYYYHFQFDSAWAATPANGDLFTFGVRYGTLTVSETLCRLNITALLPSINYDSGAEITTDLGNGYSITKRPKIETVSGWVSPEAALKLDGEKIFDAIPGDTMAGAYRAAPGGLLGVVAWTALAADGATVTEIVPPFSTGSIVTKRFV